jgi:hypothetical protein
MQVALANGSVTEGLRGKKHCLYWRYLLAAVKWKQDQAERLPMPVKFAGGSEMEARSGRKTADADEVCQRQ